MQTELVRLKTMIKAGGSIENPARVRELRKTIARVMTIENEPKPIEKKKKEPKKEKKKKEKKKPKSKEDKEE
jgi:ribosomal protein L29